jgi:hypothetical protein
LSIWKEVQIAMPLPLALMHLPPPTGFVSALNFDGFRAGDSLPSTLLVLDVLCLGVTGSLAARFCQLG